MAETVNIRHAIFENYKFASQVWRFFHGLLETIGHTVRFGFSNQVYVLIFLECINQCLVKLSFRSVCNRYISSEYAKILGKWVSSFGYHMVKFAIVGPIN